MSMKEEPHKYKLFGPALPADIIRCWIYRKAPRWARKLPFVRQGEDAMARLSSWKNGVLK